MATGLSDNGIVVGVTLEWVDPDDDFTPAQFVHRAFVWQAGDALHPSILQPQTVIPLPIIGDDWQEPVLGSLQLQWNAAFDVNSSGDIVGDTNVRPGNEPTQPIAFIQSLQAGLEGIDPGEMKRLDGLESSTARSLTDRFGDIGSIIVVGSTADFPELAQGENPDSEFLYGDFPSHNPGGQTASRWEISSDAEMTQQRLAGTWVTGECPSTSSEAFGINRRPDLVGDDGEPVNEFVVGLSRTCLTVNELCGDQSVFLPGSWLIDTADLSVAEGLFGMPTEPPYSNGVAYDSAAVVVHELDGPQVTRESVGLIRKRSENSQNCIEDAVRWGSGQTPLLVLPTIAEPGSGIRTHAYATNARGLIAGATVSPFIGSAIEEHGLLWVDLDGPAGDDYQPQVRRLSDHVVLKDPGQPGLQRIIAGTDVNADGWITGIGLYGVGEGDESLEVEVGVLLIPMGPCPEDVDQDGDVDADDLAIVRAYLTTTSPCPPNLICRADVDGDHDIDRDDANRVLRKMTQSSCVGEALSSPLAAVWLAAGGEDFLRNDPLSPLQVEEVMVEDDEMANFVNLLLLLMETP